MTDDANDASGERDGGGDPAVRDDLEAIIADDDAAHRLDRLHRIATGLAGLSTERAVYDHAIAGAHELFDVRHVVVAIPRGDDWTAVTSTHAGTDARLGEGSMVAADVEAVLERNETVIEERTIETDEGTFENARVLCSPIGEPGVLQLVTETATFDEMDARYAKLLGAIIAARLEQLALTEELEAVESQLASFTDSQSRMFEQTSHEIRTRLTAIIGYAEILSDDDVGSLSDDQREFTQLVLRKAIELEAAIEALTSSFDRELTNVRAGRKSEPDLARAAPSEPVDGPFVFLHLDAEVSSLLADQLTTLGYDVTIAADAERARDAVRRDPSSTVVVDLVADGNGIELAETIRREDGSEETTVRVASILRDETAGLTQLGASVYATNHRQSIVEAVTRLLGVAENERLCVLVFDRGASDDSASEFPANWELTTVDDLDGARDSLRSEPYDLALARTDGLSDEDRTVVDALRKKRRGRRLPVVLVDREPDGADVRYVLGGKLFVQRPLTAADFASTLIAMPTDDTSVVTRERDEETTDS